MVEYDTGVEDEISFKQTKTLRFKILFLIFLFAILSRT
jgi:hypothetical protein